MFLPCPNSYQALPQRVRLFCEWALTQPDWEYVFKTDDDCRLDIDRLLKLCGTDKSKVISATIWVPDIRLREKMNIAWNEWTGGQNLTNSNIVNGQATVTGTLEYTTGDVGVTIELQKRNGEWCVNYVETDS